MEKKYILELDGIDIGCTKFEYADPSMGVIHGKIIFNEITSPYDFFKDHCVKFNVEINSDFSEDRFIDTVIIPQLKVFLENGDQLQGSGGAIVGMNSDNFEVTFYGVDSELMQTEFNHHFVKYYGHE